MLSSSLPDVDVPGLPLQEVILQAAEIHAERIALVDAVSGASLTYQELGASIRAFAGALAQRGYQKGDVLALFSPNTIVFPAVFHGACMAGLTVTTINVLSTSGEVAKQLVDSAAKLLVTVGAFLDRATEAAEIAGVEDVIVCDQASGFESFANLVEAGLEPPSVAFNLAEDVAALPYSSGTTGVAKGVMLTHHNLVANLAQMQAAARHSADDVILVVLPMFHIYGLQVLVNLGLAHGATLVTMPKFELDPYLAALSSHRVTRAYVAPPIVVALAKHPHVDDHDLSALKVINSAAAPLDGGIAQQASARLGVPVVQGYGLTEVSPATHMTPFGEPAKPGSVGKLLPMTEARLVDVETGQDTSGPGEIWVRGPQVMKGYLNRADATAATIDSEGWLHTGDVATIDSDGEWFIVDRLKELIKYKGYRVAPAELEAELLTSPAIADAAVIGANLDGEEVPKAFVVRAADAPDLTADEVMSYIASRVASYKRIRIVEFIQVIPKSPSGKILRKGLRTHA